MPKKKTTETNTKVSDITNSLHSQWVEKYRPTTVNDLVVSDDVKKFVENIIKTGDIPHLLLHGKTGVGKNSIVNVIMKNVDANYLTINASSENGVDTIRDKIQSFANTASWGNKLKVIILNEADGLTTNALDSLRDLMESASATCRLILTCNTVSKISDPVRGRCVEFELKPDNIMIAGRLADVLDSENIDYDYDYIELLVKTYGNNLRKMINESQKYSRIYDKLTSDIIKTGVDDKFVDYFDKVFESNSIKEISDITKKMVFDEEIYTILKDYCIEKYDNPDVVIAIADSAYKSKFIADRDLVFLSCIFTVKDIIKNN